MRELGLDQESRLDERINAHVKSGYQYPTEFSRMATSLYLFSKKLSAKLKSRKYTLTGAGTDQGEPGTAKD